MGLNFVVDAAVIHDGKVLLVKNRKNYGLLNGWILPGGKLNGHSESFEDAAIRELREECGITVKPERIVSVFVSPLSLAGRTGNDVFVVVGFLARPESTNVQPSAGEISEAGWFPLDALPGDIFPDALKQLKDGGLVK